MRPEDLVERYYSSVYNLAYRTLGRREDAEDVAQQTFARALPRLSEVRRPDAVRAWLLAIAANMCQDQFRRPGRRLAAPDDAPPDWEALPDTNRFGAPPGVVELHELRLDVWRAVLTLPAQQRLVLALRELHGMSYYELAQTMGTSVSAIETLLFRARQGFRRAYSAAVPPTPGNATCSDVMTRLSASIDGELTRQEQARIDGHLPVCSNCRFAARELRATSRLYGLLPLLGPSAAAQTAAVVTASTVAVVTGSAVGGFGPGAGGVATLGAVKFGLGALAAVVMSVSTAVPGTTWPVEASRAPTPRIVAIEVPPAPTGTELSSTIAQPAPTTTSVASEPERVALPARTESASAPRVVPPPPAAPTLPPTLPTEVLPRVPTRPSGSGAPPKPPVWSATPGPPRVVVVTTKAEPDPPPVDTQVDDAPRSPVSGDRSAPRAGPDSHRPDSTPNGKPSDVGSGKPPTVVTGKSANAAPGKPPDAPTGKPLDVGSGKPPTVVPGKPADAAPAGKPSDVGSGKPPTVVPGKAADAAPGKPPDAPAAKPPSVSSGTSPSKPADAPAAKPSDSGAAKPSVSTAPPATSPRGKPADPGR